MKAEVLYRNDPERPLTDPLPELGGRRFIFRIYSGDYCDPFRDPDGWFGPQLPRLMIRAVLSWMPFVAWRWPGTTRGGYFGFKLYGVDSENYKTWIPVHDVCPGSQACHFSIRPFANLIPSKPAETHYFSPDTQQIIKKP